MFRVFHLPLLSSDIAPWQPPAEEEQACVWQPAPLWRSTSLLASPASSSAPLQWHGSPLLSAPSGLCTAHVLASPVPGPAVPVDAKPSSSPIAQIRARRDVGSRCKIASALCKRASKRLHQLAAERRAWALEVRNHLQASDVVQKHGVDSPHIEAAFRKGSIGTLRRHWAGWKRFKHFCAKAEVVPGEASEASLAEFAAIFDECNADVPALQQIRGKGKPSLRSSLEAIEFLRRRTGLPAWEAALKSPVIKGYAAGAALTDSKVSATALPLCAIVGFEIKLRDASAPLGLRLAAGWFLMCVWGSLRFCDGSSVAPTSLSMKNGVLHGFCRNAKGNPRGLPFACIAQGLLPGPDWGAIFIQVQETWLSNLDCDAGEVDFCLPAIKRRGCEILACEAESWHVASLLREFLADAGVVDVHSFCVHGIKATMLAWSGQVAAVSKDSRRRQGHHASDVVDLYAGDDVLESLRTQLSVLQAIEEGWRPSRPLRRGAAAPVPEPELQVRLPTEGLSSRFRHLLPWELQKQIAEPRGNSCQSSHDKSEGKRKKKDKKDKKSKKRKKPSSSPSLEARARPPAPPTLPSSPARRQSERDAARACQFSDLLKKRTAAQAQIE